MLLGWVLGYMLYHHKSSNKTIGAGVITAASAATDTAPSCASVLKITTACRVGNYIPRLKVIAHMMNGIITGGIRPAAETGQRKTEMNLQSYTQTADIPIPVHPHGMAPYLTPA